MQIRYPEPDDSEEARLGTAAHHYVAETLLGRDCPVGTIAPNGVPIDAEMIDCAQALLRDVRDTLAAATPGAVIRVEQRVSMARTVHPHNYGTPDVYLLDIEKHALHVWDYKYGHRYVDAFCNWQMIDYAIGVLETEGMVTRADRESWRRWRISVTVAQPRNYAPEGPIRDWYLSGSALREYAGQLAVAAREASEPDAPLRTGEHCYGCSAQVHCAANQRARGNAVDVAYRQVPAQMTDEALGLEKRQNDAAQSRLKARQTAIDEMLAGRLRDGARGTGWAMEPTTGRERWRLPDAEVIAAARMVYDVDIAKPLEAITPAQAAKKGVDRAVIADYAERPTGAMKLVAVDETTALRAFPEPDRKDA